MMTINYKPTHPKWLPYGAFAFLVFNAFVGLAVLASIGSQNQKEKFAYVQNSLTGKVEVAEVVDRFKVTNANVKRFIQQWKMATFSYSGAHPDGTLDRGENLLGAKVPTSFLQGMNFVEAPFREEYERANIIAYKDSFPLESFVAGGNFTSKIEPTIEVNNLTEMAPGRWSLYVVSTRTITPQDKKQIAYEIKNEYIELSVIPPRVNTWELKKSPYSPIIKELEAQRMMITNIKSIPITQ
jgi:hypothetical protein